MTQLFRPCNGCGQTDDHPRHHHVTPDDRPDELFHLDCHAALGCECCAAQVEGAEGKTGEAMRQHIVGLGSEFHDALMAQLNGGE